MQECKTMIALFARSLFTASRAAPPAADPRRRPDPRERAALEWELRRHTAALGRPQITPSERRK
jgi:hypothetical protein